MSAVRSVPDGSERAFDSEARPSAKLAEAASFRFSSTQFCGVTEAGGRLEKTQESIVLGGVSDLVGNGRGRALLGAEIGVNVLSRYQPERACKESENYERQAAGHSAHCS